MPSPRSGTNRKYAGVPDEYAIPVSRSDFSVDSTGVSHAGRHVNHNFRPEAGFSVVRLHDHHSHILSIGSMSTIPAESELVVSYKQL